MRQAKRRRRRGGQTGENLRVAELTTPALRATPPLRGGEFLFSQVPHVPSCTSVRLPQIHDTGPPSNISDYGGIRIPAVPSWKFRSERIPPLKGVPRLRCKSLQRRRHQEY